MLQNAGDGVKWKSTFAVKFGSPVPLSRSLRQGGDFESLCEGNTFSLLDRFRPVLFAAMKERVAIFRQDPMLLHQVVDSILVSL